MMKSGPLVSRFKFYETHKLDKSHFSFVRLLVLTTDKCNQFKFLSSRRDSEVDFQLPIIS